jgi:SAM-dependent methyltransferase
VDESAIGSVNFFGPMPIDLEAYREQSLATWRQVARGWEDRRDWLLEITALVSAWLLEKAKPLPGQTFLDLAAGTGDLGLAVAERVGDSGHVISGDFSPEMVDAARRTGEARGLTNVEYRVLDAERLALDDESVDGVVCRFGYMLMADPTAALAETRRVLRAGGPLAFSVWAAPDRNPWATLPALTLVQRGHIPPPEPGAPGIFALADPDRIRELVTRAGFGAPEELEEIAVEFRYADADDLWDTLVRFSGPLAHAIAALPDDERRATRTAIEKSLEPYRQHDGSYRAPGATWGIHVR